MSRVRLVVSAIYSKPLWVQYSKTRRCSTYCGAVEAYCARLRVLCEVIVRQTGKDDSEAPVLNANVVRLFT